MQSNRVFSPTSCWMLPWVLSLPGILTDGLGDCFQPPPLTRLVVTVVTHSDSPRLRVSISSRPVRLLEPDVPHRVWHLMSPGVRLISADPGYAFTSRSLRHYCPSTYRIFGPTCSLLTASGWLVGADQYATIWRQMEGTPKTGSVHRKKRDARMSQQEY